MDTRKLNKFFVENNLPLWYEEETQFLYKRSRDGLEIISNGFIDVEQNNIFQIGHMPDADEFSVSCVVMSQGHKKDFIELFVRRTKQRISFSQYEIISYFEASDLKIRHQQLFLKACQLYIQMELDKAIKKQKFVYPVIGWYDNGYELVFHGINSPSVEKYDERLFRDIYYKKRENLNPVNLLQRFDKIADNKVVILLFAYLFYAVGQYSYPALHDGKIQARPQNRAALCICGSHPKTTPTAVANLFLNMFSVDEQRIHTLLKSDNIHLDSIMLNLDSVRAFQDTVQIVSSSKGTIGKNNRTVRKILLSYMKGIRGYAPVFISKNPIDIDEIVSVDISELGDIDYSERERSVIRQLIFDCIYTFVEGIGKIYRWNKFTDFREELADYDAFRSQYSSFGSKLFTEEYDENKIYYYLKWYYYFKLFLCILKHNIKSVETISEQEKRRCNQILTKIENLLNETIKEGCRCKILPLDLSDPEEEVDLERAFKQYIVDLFIWRKRTPDFVYWSGSERNGSKEECFYLEYSKALEDFQKYANINLQRNEQELFALLKEKELILTKKGANGKEKVKDHIKYYVLAVRKQKIMDA